MPFREIFALFKSAVQEWMADNAPRLSAALAYYAIFSLAPLLVITVSIIALVFGAEAAQGQIAGQLEGLVGREAALMVQQAIVATSKSTGNSALTAIIGLGVLLFGASNVFGELKNALNLIFGVKARPGNAILGILRERFLSFSMVLCIGFLLLTSLLISSLVTALSTFMTDWLPMPPLLFKAADFVVSLGILTVLFGLIFKFLPNVRLRWRDVGWGAFLTAVLFNFGKSLIAFYLGTSSVGSAFGASGSVIVILLWIFYASGILFFGAEFTKVLVQRPGGPGIVPNHFAMLITEEQKQARRESEAATAKATSISGIGS